MQLPSPSTRLADCVWLPRIVAKARCHAAGQLPEEYTSRFGHPTGVDGQFLAFFDLTREDILDASGQDDDGVTQWFLAEKTRSTRIGEWNHLAVNLGRPGFPMADRLPIALQNSYPHLLHRGLKTVFEVLEADETA
jgi:hypothetical protein